MTTTPSSTDASRGAFTMALRAALEPGASPPATDAALPSYAQERLWFMAQLDPANPFYNVPASVRLRGPLDVARLEAALTALVARHEIMRATFSAPNGYLVQHVRPPAPVSLPVLDLSSVAGTRRRDDAATQLAREEVRRPFDLARGPLWRAELLRLSPADHLMLLTMHHIIADGWSVAALWRELAALYSGADPAERRPTIRYADFARWQRQWLAGPAREAQLTYWRRQLAALPAPLPIPTDRMRAGAPSFRGGREYVRLDERLTARLRALGREEDATLFMTLLAAIAALLARYSGTHDIVIGSPVANRRLVELEDVLGCFVNMLAIRTDLSGRPTVGELIRRVRDTALGAFDNQDLPFEMLVEALDPARDLSRNPLFQVVFAFQNTPPLPTALGDLALEPFAIETGASKFDLEFHMWETGAEVEGFVTYATDLFDAETIRGMVRHLTSMLEAMAAGSERRVGELPILGGAERRRILTTWNRSAADHRGAPPIHVLFERQARRTPDAPALIPPGPAAQPGAALTFGEVNRRATRLAAELRSLGVGPEAMVGLCTERGPELVIGMLAILKAGGAYVPLDPTYPAERLAQMMRDARPRVVVTQRSVCDRIPRGGALLRLIDDDYSAPIGDDVEIPLSPENLAYGIYTSGSTGTPKAVIGTHGALSNLMLWHQREFAVTAADRATQVGSMAFDACGWEMWPYLISGASVSFVGDEVRASPAALLDWIVRRRVTVSYAPTPIVEALLGLAWPGDVALRLLFTGGDRLTRFPDSGARFPVVNIYGPTENTVATTFAVLSPGAGAGALPPIGRHIDGGRVYILDEEMRPVPIGAYGEVYVAGAGLARGYLGDAALTAAKFVPDPFSRAGGGRLYRTGDVARFLRDGSIAFLGRRDDQVKIRAFRIELGEIEATLRTHPAVRGAVALVDGGVGAEGASTGKRLVAAVVPSPEWRADRPLPAALRCHLAERLPDYMVPTEIAVLDELPLTPNGKLDRAGIAARLRRERREDERPATPTERAVAAIWRELLGERAVGLHDDFFALGGHSLLGAVLAARIGVHFGIDFAARTVFERPTIAKLAAVVDEALGAVPATERTAR